MKPSKINKILEHKFQSLLYGTSNTKFQNVFFLEHVKICGFHKQGKKWDRSVRKKKDIMEIKSLKIYDKVNIFKIASSHFWT